MNANHADTPQYRQESSGGLEKRRRNLTLPPERELSQLAAPSKSQPLRIEDNPRSGGGQCLWRRCQVAPEKPWLL
jgi:hypothetical protein